MFRRAAALAAALLVALCTNPIPAGATSLQATAGGAQTVSSAQWGVLPSQTGLTFNLSLLSDPSPQYFTVTNNGTRALVATTYTVGLSTSGIGLGGATLTVSFCAVAWSGSSCATPNGSHAFTGASSSWHSTATTVPANASDVLYLQASVTGARGLLATLTAAISTSVSSLSPRDISAATTTNL